MGFVKGEFVPLDPLLPPFGGAKGGPRRVGALTKPCKRLRDADRRDEMIALIFAVNPSVSLAADSLSLRLGHGAGLTAPPGCHSTPRRRFAAFQGRQAAAAGTDGQYPQGACRICNAPSSRTAAQSRPPLQSVPDGVLNYENSDDLYGWGLFRQSRPGRL